MKEEGKRVLIAEDNDISRRMLSSVVSKLGYDVVPAADGNEAWTILHGPQPPLLVILDWMMPGRNGIDICREICHEEHNVPFYVILLTARNEREDILQGFEAGAHDYVSKPFDSDQLLARLRVGTRVIDLQNRLNEKVERLEAALGRITTLEGLLPICMHCHKIRDDVGSWQPLETYIEGNSSAEFSHGICPDCMTRYYARRGN